jgi:hypothetical protein
MPKNEAERFSLWKPLGALGEAVRFLTVLPVCPVRRRWADVLVMPLVEAAARLLRRRK